LPIFFSRPSTDVTFGGDAFTQIISGCAVGTDPHATNSCSAALPESVRTLLSTAFEIRVADPTAGEQVLVTVNIGTGSIVCDISLGDPSSLFVLDASPTDLTWDLSTFSTAQTVTLKVTNPPSGQVTMQILTPGGAFIDGTAMAATLLYDACEPGDRSTGNLIYSSIYGACVAAIPAGLDGQKFRFVDQSPGDQVPPIPGQIV